jgi:hypothetical protein
MQCIPISLLLEEVMQTSETQCMDVCTFYTIFPEVCTVLILDTDYSHEYMKKEMHGRCSYPVHKVAINNLLRSYIILCRKD